MARMIPLTVPRIDSTCDAALRLVERDERPARFSGSIADAFDRAFEQEPRLMSHREAQQIYDWVHNDFP